MLPMTKINGVPDNKDVHEGMAFFANTGPFATKCGECKHRGYTRTGREKFNPDTNQWESRLRRTSGCAMFHMLTGSHGPTVKAEWPSCKYFERTPAG